LAFVSTIRADNLSTESRRFGGGNKRLWPDRAGDERAGAGKVDLSGGHTRHSR